MSLVTQVDQNVKGDKYGGDDMNRLISNPLVKPESHGDSMVRQSPYFHTLPSCPAPGILGSSTPSRGHSVHRINFEMCILDQDLNKLHVYSSLQSEIGSAARKLDDIPDWYSMYPQLATYYNQGRLDGEIILFETNFDLMDNHPPSKSKLSIDFTIDIARGMEYTNWECHSNFYEKGVLQKSVSTLMNSEYVSSTGDARIVVLLHSKWWVDHFTNIIKQRQEIKDRDFDALQKEDERVCNRIRTISVVQEIWATHQSCRSSSERIAILIWSFRQTRNHKVATTTWRKLILPAIKAKNNTPTQGNRVSSWQPSPVIDTAARDHGLSQNVPVYTQCFNPDSIFAENSETFLAGSGTRLSSPSSTPLANHRSFPSSTSTSFASSISSSTLPLDASQEPNFALHEFIITSQDLAYANPDFDFGSKDLVYTAKDFKNSSESSETHSSQHPAYCTHDGNSVDCQNPAYSSQDYFYNTKAISYESQELKSPYPAPPLSQYQPNGQEFHSMTEAIDDPQELTGIHTRLSFAELEDPPPSYDAPFVVPLVSNMVPQKIRHGDLEQSSTDVQNDIRKSPYLPSSSRSQELLDMEHFQAMDQTVQWTGIRFQNGAFGDAGNMIEHGQTLGEMDGLEKNLDDDLGFR